MRIWRALAAGAMTLGMVVGGAAPLVHVGTPTVTTTPSHGKAGAKVVVAGADFTASEKVNLVWDGAFGVKTTLGAVTASSAGAFSATVTIPGTAPYTYTIAVSGATGQAAGNGSFVVDSTIAWSSAANAPSTMLANASGADHQGHLFFTGGVTQLQGGIFPQLSNTLYMYTVATNKWSKLPNAPKNNALNAGAYATAGKHHYFFITGGANGVNIWIQRPTQTKALYRYDIDAKKWKVMASVPITTGANTMAWDGGNYLYVTAGVIGFDANNNYAAIISPNLYRYDIAKNKWAAMAPAPDKMAANTACYDGNGHVFYTGGGDSLQISGGIEPHGTKNFYIYTIKTNTWSRGADVPDFNGADVAMYDGMGNIIITDGYNTQSWNTTMYEYNIPSNTWTTYPSQIPTALYGLAGAYDASGHWFLVGGYNQSTKNASNVASELAL